VCFVYLVKVLFKVCLCYVIYEFISIRFFRPNDTSVGEWAIVELQGELETRNSSSENQLFIGDLHYTNKVLYML
jgi:hypothetical protein